jgi:hypothetical protein
MAFLAQSTFSAESNLRMDRKSAATAFDHYPMENASNCIGDVEAPI